MNHFSKDQMKCKSNPCHIWAKKEEKLFYQTKDHYFLFLNEKAKNFQKKNKIFYQTLFLIYYQQTSHTNLKNLLVVTFQFQLHFYAGKLCKSHLHKVMNH